MRDAGYRRDTALADFSPPVLSIAGGQTFIPGIGGG